jgi:uncharacterized protein YndB with AHSA1/START domain
VTGHPKSTLTSVVLTVLAEAEPERVWDALTATGTPLSYLQGLIVESDWQPGSMVSMHANVGEAPGLGALYGEVLAAERPHRLSYTLGEAPADPSVYVTWQLLPFDGTTMVRLYADEPSPSSGDHEELELIWLRIVSALVKYLDGPRLPVDHWD